MLFRFRLALPVRASADTSRRGETRRGREYGSRPTSRTESRGCRHRRTSRTPQSKAVVESSTIGSHKPSEVPAVVPDPQQQLIHQQLPMGPHFHVVPPSMSRVSSHYSPLNDDIHKCNSNHSRSQSLFNNHRRQLPTSPMPMRPSYQPSMSSDAGSVHGPDMPMTSTPIVVTPSGVGRAPTGMIEYDALCSQ